MNNFGTILWISQGLADISITTLSSHVRNQICPPTPCRRPSPAWKRIAEISPAPFDEMVTDGVARMRDLVLDEEPAAEAAPKKKATRKPAAKKTTAKKSTKKAAAKK